MEERIEIVSDVDGRIDFNKIIPDYVVRKEVEEVETKIEALKSHIADLDKERETSCKELESLIAKLDYAKQIIAIADEKKARELALESEIQTPTTEAQ